MTTQSIYGENLSGDLETVRVIDRKLPTLSVPFLQSVAFGKIPGHELIHKFGINESVGTTITVVSASGFYQVPTAPVTLFATSTSANDTIAGTGARTVAVEYLDGNWNRQLGTIAMNGLTQSTSNITNVRRVTRAYVTSSGTYATATSASQKGTITIHQTGGTPVFASLPQISTGFGAGQSLIAVYTVPAGYTAFMLNYILSADSNQTTDVYFFARDNADDITSPYGGIMRAQNTYSGLNSTTDIKHETWEKYEQKTDIGFMAKVAAGTGSVSAEFEMLLVDNNFL